jgi:hypothetical protein
MEIILAAVIVLNVMLVKWVWDLKSSYHVLEDVLRLSNDNWEKMISSSNALINTLFSELEKRQKE